MRKVKIISTESDVMPSLISLVVAEKLNNSNNKKV
jgi:hypothetical protein